MSTATIDAPEQIVETKTKAPKKKESVGDTANPAPAKQRTRPREVFSNPVTHREVTFSTQQAQRIAKGSLEYTAYALFSLDVIMPIIGDTQKTEEVDDLISKCMIETGKQFDLKLKECQAKLASLAITDLIAYSNPIKRSLEVQSPRIARFIRLIEQMDFLIRHQDTLWFNGETTNSERSNDNNQWQTAMRKLASLIVSSEKLARRAANEKGKSKEVDLAAPQRETITEEELDLVQEAETAE